MAELLLSIKDAIVEYYPIVVAGLIAVGGAIGIAYVTFTQAKAIVQPILDKIEEFRNRDDEEKISLSTLSDINTDVLKIDLLAKIANPTISPELTLLYQAQLDKLQTVTDKATTVIATAEDKVDEYL